MFRDFLPCTRDSDASVLYAPSVNDHCLESCNAYVVFSSEIFRQSTSVDDLIVGSFVVQSQFMNFDRFGVYFCYDVVHEILRTVHSRDKCSNKKKSENDRYFVFSHCVSLINETKKYSVQGFGERCKISSRRENRRKSPW